MPVPSPSADRATILKANAREVNVAPDVDMDAIATSLRADYGHRDR